MKLINNKFDFTCVCVVAFVFLFVSDMAFASEKNRAASAGETSGGMNTADRVGKIEIEGLRSISETELLYLLDIKEGKPLDRTGLRAGIKRAFLKGIFDDIIVERTGPDRNTIRIIVKEKPVISSVDIEGNRYLSKGFISKVLSVKKGRRYNAGALEITALELNDMLKKKGFPESRVAHSVEDSGQGSVAININISEGTPLLIKDIRISGDVEIVSGHLKLAVGDIFDRTVMEESGEKIKSDLKNGGYVGSILSHSFENGVLTIKLTKGPKLDMSFEGNSALSSASLKKEVPFFELDSFSYELLEETVKRFIAAYDKEGYIEAQIAPIVTEGKEGMTVTFYINEGTQYRVDKIEFEGVTLPVDRLKALIRLKIGDNYNSEILAADDETIREFYHSLGYLYIEAKEPVVNTQEGNVSIIFRYTEGIQVKMSGINIVDNREIPSDKVLDVIPLKKGNPYNEVDIINSRVKILDLYHRKGFVDAVITIEKSIEGKDAVITFKVREGAKSFFGKAVVIGNKNTREEVITRAFQHREDEPLDNSLLLTERQRLYRTGIFSGVDIYTAERIGQHRDVLYRVEEADAGAFEFGAGYAEYEKFRGFFDVSYKNLFGMNREAAFRTELSALNRRFILSYFDPWFIYENLAFKAQVMKEYKKERNIDTDEIRYRLDRYVAVAGFEKKLNNRIKAEIYYELTQVKTYDVKPDVILTHEDAGTLIISAVKAALIYDSRDNPFEPHSGILAGITNKIASSVILSETNFNKVQMYVNNYQAITKGLVLAVSLRGGYAFSLDSNTNLPLVERFFLGGRTTVRGYDQDMLGPKGKDNDPTGGNIFLMGNVEMRIDVWKGFGLVVFGDGGNVWQNIDDFSAGKLKYTTGLGLRYNTPVGPIRVDYGYKLNRDRDEGVGAVHFSVGHAF
jgi:outer membrane protein insertion porin family